MLHCEFRPHRPLLPVDARQPQKLFAMLKLLPDQQAASARPPLALAMAVDTSMSMYEFSGTQLDRKPKIDIAIDAAHRLVDDARLRDDDLFALVHFNDKARTLVEMAAVWDRSHLHRAINDLRKYSGLTAMGDGMSKAAAELARVDAHYAKRLFLLTDGETQDEDLCRRVSGDLAAAGTAVVPLGFGDDYNDQLLGHIAAVTQGRWYHLLGDAHELETVLESELGMSVKEVLNQVVGELSCAHGMTVDSVTRVYPFLALCHASASMVEFGGLAAGDYTVFIFECTLPAGKRSPGPSKLMSLLLAGNAPGLARPFRLQQSLHLEAGFTSDDIEAAQLDAEVMGYVQQRNIDQTLTRATQLLGASPGQSKTLLLNARAMTQKLGNSAMTHLLDNALDELQRTGTLSPGTSRTVMFSGRTKTLRTGAVGQSDKYSDDEIRRLAGV